ncbi:hypothetical protein [Lysinibacillus parviboronicapiens]|uniref:hypothetical protein n=1 Tax=Lysinibacillus parviboronicapiens TaxID=436516 RepID=UPI0006D0437E|nr:hypothetical protein [Lysinibacillus parviboronicapiens]
MKEVRIEDWLLNIEVEKTAAIYEDFTEVCAGQYYENFCKASLLLDDKVLHFGDVLGLDLHKPSAMNAFPVEGEQVMYSGHYTICGEIIAGELEAWDIVIGAHCFSLIEEDDHKPKLVTEPHFLIGFEVVLPWQLPESMELIKK